MTSEAMRAPAIFLSHGAPTVAVADDEYTDALRKLGSAQPAPQAIAVVSAHWQSPAPRTTGAREPETIHDFGGFPDELYAIRYPAKGSPVLARRIADRLGGDVDRERGLDHGAWVPLRHMFPSADVPVVQVSLPERRQKPDAVIALGRQLAFLRDEGVWLVGSGGVVHNLSRLSPPDAAPADWARAFDDWAAERVAALDLTSLADYRSQAPYATLAAPTPEHLDPLLVVLGAALPGDRVVPVHSGFSYGTLSMRCFALSDGKVQG